MGTRPPIVYKSRLSLGRCAGAPGLGTHAPQGSPVEKRLTGSTHARGVWGLPSTVGPTAG